jgi:hypothetical protein
MKQLNYMKQCKHLGTKVGIADCRCAGNFNVYHCNLLEQNAIPYNVEPYELVTEEKREKFPPILNCNLCTHNTTKKQNHFLPPSC